MIMARISEERHYATARNASYMFGVEVSSTSLCLAVRLDIRVTKDSGEWKTFENENVDDGAVREH